MNKRTANIVVVVTLVFFSVLGTQALFHDGLYSAHDIWHQVARLHHYSTSVLNGQIFPNWISTMANGFGYPLFIFSYHIPWIFSIPFILIGFSVQTTLKILFFLSFVCSGFTFYLFMYEYTKNKLASTIASVTYLWAPYHFLTLFVSAAIGTAYAFIFLPLLFLSIVYLFKPEKEKMGVVVFALSFAGLMLAHLMTFIYILPFVGIFFVSQLLQHKTTVKELREKIVLGIAAGLLGIGLIAFYILPLVSYFPLIKAKTDSGGFSNIYSSNFVTLKQLVYSKWGFGPIISNAKDGEISLQIGVAQWLGVIAAIFYLLFGRLFDFIKVKSQLLIAFLVMFACSVFGMLDYSKPFWDFATHYISLDYPFRLLLVSVFVGSVLIGLVISFVKQVWLQAILVVCFLLVSLYTNKHHITVNMYTYFPTELYVRSEKTTNTFNEYLPTTASERLINIDNQPVVLSTPSATNVITHNRGMSFDINLENETDVLIRQFNFPGQTVYIDGQRSEHLTSPEGLIMLPAVQGIHRISVTYMDTLLMQIGKFFSLLSLLIITAIVFTYRKSKEQKNVKK